jgi:hypothetical protein
MGRPARASPAREDCLCVLAGMIWRAAPSVERPRARFVRRRQHQAVAKRCHRRRRDIIV